MDSLQNRGELTIKDLLAAFEKLKIQQRDATKYYVYFSDLPDARDFGEPMCRDHDAAEHNKRAQAQLDREEAGDEYLPLDLWDVTP